MSWLSNDQVELSQLGQARHRADRVHQGQVLLDRDQGLGPRHVLAGHQQQILQADVGALDFPQYGILETGQYRRRSGDLGSDLLYQLNSGDPPP